MASVGDFSQFDNARQFGAWLGLVPSQNSTGGKAKLGRITKRGDDPEQIDHERADDAQREKDLNLPATNQPKNPAASGQQQQPDAPQNPNQGDQ